MPRVTCTGCSKNLNLDDKYAGKKIKCPVCKATVDVPAAKLSEPGSRPAVAEPPRRVVASAVQPPANQPPKIEIHCSCGLTLRTPQTNAGATVQCPKCKVAMVVPYPQAAAPATNDAYDPFGTNLPPANFAQPAPNAAGDFWNATNYVAPPPAAGTKSPGSHAATNPYLSDLSGDEKRAVASALAVESHQGESTTSYRPILFAVIALFVGPILMFVGYNERSTVAMLQSEGVDTVGLVTEGVESRGRRGRRSYSLEVAYRSATGESFTNSFSVSESVFHSHCNSSTITNPKISLRYARSDPSVARLSSQSDNSSVTMTIGAIVSVIGVAATGFCIWMYTRNQA